MDQPIQAPARLGHRKATVQIGYRDGEPVIFRGADYDYAILWLDAVWRQAVRAHIESNKRNDAAVESLRQLANYATDERVRLDAAVELLNRGGS